MSAVNPSRSLILVVDDEPLVAALMGDALSSEGYEVDTAKNGREALERIASRSYDLILSDLRMPELDGMALYRELEKRWPELLGRLIFVSGTAEQPDYADFLKETGIPLLSKPFRLEVLLRLVKQSL